MKKLRKTFTCLILFFTMLGIAPIMVSCQQQTNKQKPATVNQEPQKPSGPAASREAVPEKKSDQPAVPGGNIKKNPNSQNARMLSAFDKNLGETPRSLAEANMTPDQKKAKELFLSGSKKAKDGDQEGAIGDFTQSLNLVKTPLVYMRRGYAEMVLEDYNRALNDMNEAIKMSPSLDKAYFGRGVCRFEQKDFKSAEEDLKVFVEKNKTTAMAYNYLAGCRYMQQDFKGALENYEMVAKLDPKYQDIYTNRGMMKHYLKDLKGAVEDYDKALSIDPDNATAYNNRGAAKLNQEDPKSALDDFNKAISLRKDYADAYQNRGKAKFSLYDKTGACEDWKKAYSLGIQAAKDLVIEYCK